MSRETPPAAVSLDGVLPGDWLRLSNGHMFEVRSLAGIIDWAGQRREAVWGMEHVPEGSDTPAAIGRMQAGAHQRTITVDGCYRSFGNVMFYVTHRVRTRRRKV